MESTGGNNLSMRWIPVTDAAGRVRMEAVWVTETAPVSTPVSAPAAAPAAA